MDKRINKGENATERVASLKWRWQAIMKEYMKNAEMQKLGNEGLMMEKDQEKGHR